jgi:hypothetical protein
MGIPERTYQDPSISCFHYGSKAGALELWIKNVIPTKGEKDEKINSECVGGIFRVGYGGFQLCRAFQAKNGIAKSGLW